METGTVKLPIQSIKNIPAFMGETDIIKAIEMLPGVKATSEGSSGFSVRGGNIDQNLILLDEATVYNASHFLGFFSIFNEDAIKDVKLYKGDIPASDGGRLSSLLDVRMKSGSVKKFSSEGGIGTISSRLTLEIPVVRDKTSVLVSGRRTYADLFLPLSNNKDIANNKLYFYDLNFKVNQIFNNNNRLLYFRLYGTGCLQEPVCRVALRQPDVHHRVEPPFLAQVIFKLRAGRLSDTNTCWERPAAGPILSIGIREWMITALKADWTYFASPVSTFKFGLSSIYHHFTPGIIRGTGESSLFNEFRIPDNNALEHAVYVSDEEKLGYRLSIRYGLRLSVFQNIGKGTVYHFNDAFQSTDSTVYPAGKIFNTYAGLEPRLMLNYTLNENNSLKASYSRTRQYVQLAENSVSGTPLAVWFPASPNVRPQMSDQFSAGIFPGFPGSYH